MPDGKFNWILHVQDNCTKFTWLKALKQKCGLEVAKALFKIFGVFGTPYIIQSDNALPIVTNIKNRKFHSGIYMSPYKAVFGQELFVGLKVLNLPVEEKKKVCTAKKLYALLGN